MFHEVAKATTHLMFTEVRRPSVTLATRVTLEGFLASVVADVELQALQTHKRLSADFTLEWLDAGVQTHVLIEAELLPELLAAQLTRVELGTRVDYLVRVQARQTAELLVTRIARVWVLACMGHCVCLGEK